MAPVKKVRAGAAPKKGAKKNDHNKPSPVPLDTIVTDLSKTQWKVGPSIGTGGFGEIYLAAKLGDKIQKADDYKYVAKFEPHSNGPLFVEMHFYLKNMKKEIVDKFCKQNGLKKLGVPYFIAHGSHELNATKHRFLIIPRYGKDIAYYFRNNGNKFEEHTIYRLAIQMLYAYEYIHSCSYVHADLKGSNIMLEYAEKNKDQVYLLDYGLVSRFVTGDYKPDPKKKHNGTIEYTSIDAHNGVVTVRGDMEILAYNLIEWFGIELPWIKEKLLSNPQKVQLRKEAFMKDVKQSLKALFKDVPAPLEKYLQIVKDMKHNETPDYNECRKVFEDALKKLKKPLLGELQLGVVKDAIKSPEASVSRKKKNTPTKRPANEDEVSPAKKAKPSTVEDDTNSSPSPTVRKTPLKRSVDDDETTPNKRMKSSKSSKTKKTNHSSKMKEPIVTITKSIHVNSLKPNSGSTTVRNVGNSNTTKACTVDLELDVSLDTNVIVNVIRKRNGKVVTPKSPNVSSPGNTNNSPRRSGRHTKQ